MLVDVQRPVLLVTGLLSAPKVLAFLIRSELLALRPLSHLLGRHAGGRLALHSFRPSFLFFSFISIHSCMIIRAFRGIRYRVVSTLLLEDGRR